MPIQGINDNKVDWAKLLNSIQGAEDSASVKVGDGKKPVENLTVVELKEEGRNLSFKPSAPELENIENGAGIDQIGIFEEDPNLNSLSGKLAALQKLPVGIPVNSAEQAAKEVMSVGVNPGAGMSGKQKFVFDFNSVAYTLLDVIQTNKNQFRTMTLQQRRNAAHHKENQADYMMTNMWTTIGLTAFSGLVQIGGAAYSASKMGGAIKGQSELANKYGVPDAANDLKMAQQNLNADMNQLKALDPQAYSELQNSDLGNVNPMPGESQAAGQNNGMLNQSGESQNDQVKIDLGEESNQPGGVNEQQPNNQANNVPGDMNNVNGDANQINGDANNANPVNENADNANPVNENADNADNANPVHENANDGDHPVEAANGDESIGGQVENPSEQSGEFGKENEIKKLKAKIEVDKQKLSEARTNMDYAERAWKADPAYMQFEMDSRSATMWGSIAEAVAGMGKGGESAASSVLNSKGMKESAVGDMNQAHAEQDSLLMGGNQDSIASVLSLLEKFVSTENNSIQDINRNF